MGDELFFPEYLNQGSEGPAVAVLQIMLKTWGLDQDNTLLIDGVYGERTAKAVADLQAEQGVDADGNFGPQTRKAFAKASGIDVNTIPANAFSGQTKAVVGAAS